MGNQIVVGRYLLGRRKDRRKRPNTYNSRTSLTEEQNLVPTSSDRHSTTFLSPATDTTIRKAKPKEYRILDFYKNEIPIKPGGEKIEDILTQWQGKYRLLEEHDGYMQWLFPSRKQKKTPDSSLLTSYEAKEIRNTAILKNRVYRAFLMMLDFYGMEMVGKNEFQLKSKWLERLDDLNRYKHNFKRITRILKALRSFGYKELMYHWLRFLAQLIYLDGKLIVASHSFKHYWDSRGWGGDNPQWRAVIDGGHRMVWHCPATLYNFCPSQDFPVPSDFVSASQDSAVGCLGYSPYSSEIPSVVQVSSTLLEQ